MKQNAKPQNKYWRHAVDDAKISGTVYDKRVKFTEADRDKIRQLHRKGVSQRGIAKEIGCSRRYVIFTIFPERLERSRKNRDWRRYHDREELTRLVRELRRRKKLLIAQGLVIPVRKTKSN